MKRGLLALVLCFVTVEAEADYLEVRRNAILKATPESGGQQVVKLEPGTSLDLASDDQQNGYYSVRTLNGERGFVYRTLVRRRPGDVPRTPPSKPGEIHGAPEGSEAAPTTPQDELLPSELPALEAGQMRIHLIDVGQGASTLLEFSCAAVLVDTGGELNGDFDSNQALEAYLEMFFARRADLHRTFALVLITHPHPDHTRGVKTVASVATIENAVTDGLTTGKGAPQQKWLEENVAQVEKVSAKTIPAKGRTSAIIDPVRCDDVDPKLTVLWGGFTARPAEWSATTFGNENNHSIVLRVDFGKASLLITGDLEKLGIKSLLAKQANTGILDVDIWQVGHHGSANATTSELLGAVTPVIALFATGDPARHQSWSAWAYGHPRKQSVDLVYDAVQRLRTARDVSVATGTNQFVTKRMDHALYATGWDGTVVITAGSDGTYDVQTEH